MSLKNDGSRMFDFNGNYEISSAILFAQANRRMNEKKSTIEDLQNEYNLLEEQTFKLYKSHVNYWTLQPEFIEKTRKWISMKNSGKDSEGNKLDGRKKYDEKDIAEYFSSNIQNLLGIDDMEIVQIIDFNFGEAKHIVFTSHGHKWELSIPIINGIGIESFRRCGESVFKLGLVHYDSEHCSCRFGSTFIEEELNDIMASGIAKYCKDTMTIEG